jgi:radical SAM superfamily enzyme YgiQ (UPF0313 family)
LNIVLATLNAKFIHASLGLRYLLANMGSLRSQTELREFTINRSISEIVDELLQSQATIIGFGVYIWNVAQTTEVVKVLKTNNPSIRIVLGGPEVSYETEHQAITHWADYVITGWGDISFARLCQALLSGAPPQQKMITGEQPPLDQIQFPYSEYTDQDLAHRLLYVEASRGCPFKCEFCLSALDKTAWPFDLERFLAEMNILYQRGARNFKFVDRTFNLNVQASVRVLQFFLELRKGTGEEVPLFLHFEVVPDHLPEKLKTTITQFPPGTLQFEVGIQSLNPDVQQTISRRQDAVASMTNLRWLLESTYVHIHADLIFGLPSETVESFANGFDQLYALGPHEIQLGVLKRLRGTPIIRHTAEHGLVFSPTPPYAVQQTGAVDALTVTRFTRFARHWDMIANSGRFKKTLPFLLQNSCTDSAFTAFQQFSDWLWARTGTTQGLTPENLVDGLFDYLCQSSGQSVEAIQSVLLADYIASGARSNPNALHGLIPKREIPISKSRRKLLERQTQHLV